jgi:hypothetical protein
LESSLRPFQSSQSIKDAIDTIRDMRLFTGQDTKARKFLECSVLILTLGPPVSHEKYTDLLELFGIEKSMTYYPATIALSYRGLRLYIHRVVDDTRHDLNEALRLLSNLEHTIFALGSWDLYMVDEISSDQLANSTTTWDGISDHVKNRRRHHIQLSKMTVPKPPSSS